MFDEVPMLGESEAPDQKPVVNRYEAIALPKKVVISDTLADELEGRIGETEGKSRDAVIAAVGSLVVDLCKDSAEARRERDGRIREQMEMLELEPPNRESPLGPDGSNIRPPLLWKNFDTLHANYLHTITNIRPMIKSESLDEETTEAANKKEDYFDALYTEGMDFRSVLDEVCALALRGGFAALRPSWRYETRVVPVTTILSPSNASELGYKVPDPGGLGALATHYKGHKARVGDVVTESKRVVVHDEPFVEPIDYFNFLISPANHPNIQTAALVGDRILLTVSQVRSGATCGLFDKAAAATVIAEARRIDSCHLSNILSDDASRDDKTDEDFSQGGDTRHVSGRSLEFVRGIVSLDLNGDDDSEDWEFVVETDTKTVLSLRPYELSTIRNYHEVVPFKRPGALYGMSIGDLMEGIQAQAETAVNMALDLAALAATFIVAYKRGAQGFTESLDIGPNFRAVEDKGDIELIEMPQLDTKYYPSIQLIEKQAEDVLALSETLQGRTSDAERTTATETSQALVAGNRRMGVAVKRIQSAIVDCHRVIEDMAGAYLIKRLGGDPDAPVPYLIGSLGQDALSSMTLAEFLTPVKWFAHGDTQNTNEVLKLQGAEKVFLAASQSPFMSGKMERLYMATRFLLEAYGVRNVSDFIGTIRAAQEQDKQNEAEAQANPPLKLPDGIEPSVNEQWFAAFLSNNPDKAEEILGYLQKIKADAAKADHTSEIEKAKSDLEVTHAKNKAELEMQQMGVAMEIKKLEMKKKEIAMEIQKVGMAETEAAQNIQQAHQLAAHEDEMRRSQHEMAEQKQGVEHQRRIGEIDAKKTEFETKQKLAAAKTPPKNGGDK